MNSSTQLFAKIADCYHPDTFAIFFLENSYGTFIDSFFHGCDLGLNRDILSNFLVHERFNPLGVSNAVLRP